MIFIDDFLNASADATTKLSQLQASYGSDRKVYTSVDEFMAERQMLLDLVVERRQTLQVSQIDSVTTDKFIYIALTPSLPIPLKQFTLHHTGLTHHF